jgi:hypothetical protein
MSNSQTSTDNLRFGLIATAVVLACAGVAALSYSPLMSAGRGALYQLALTDYNRHDYAAAIKALSYYQPSSLQSLSLSLTAKANLEQGSSQAAIAPAEAAHSMSPADSATTLLLGATYDLTGQSLHLSSLISAQKSSELVQALDKLRAPNSSQAQELYALGLLRSSQRVLAAIHQPSAQSSILQAKLALALQPGKAGALAATPFAKTAVTLDPANITARELYISVSHKTGDTVTADQQQALLDKLKAGTP